MKNKFRVLFVSYMVILFCAVLIIGSSFALFTDSVKVTNHLKTGNLDIALIRKSLEYSCLNDAGELEVYSDQSETDFTFQTNTNVFGLNRNGLLIVPGSYFDAVLVLENHGNVAFDYDVEIILNEDTKSFSDQLLITVTDSFNNSNTYLLSDFLFNNTILMGEMNNNLKQVEFKIRVEFLNDLNTDYSINNNEAKNKQINFDLIVEAVQKTND